MCVEWQRPEKFYAFVKGAQFDRFKSRFSYLLDGPPDLQLYDATKSSRDAGRAPVLEILTVKLEKSQVELDSVTGILESLADSFGASASVTRGKEDTPENVRAMMLIGWKGSDEQESGWKLPEAQRLVGQLQSLGELHRLVVDVGEIPLTAVDEN